MIMCIYMIVSTYIDLKHPIYNILSHPITSWGPEPVPQCRNLSQASAAQQRGEYISPVEWCPPPGCAGSARAAFVGDPTVASPWHRADGWCPCGEGRSSGGITQLHHGSILHWVQTCDFYAQGPRSKAVQMVMLIAWSPSVVLNCAWSVNYVSLSI